MKKVSTPRARKRTRTRIRIGISGWTYPPWRKTFYPAGLAHHRELEFASRQVNSIEVNGAFYSLQRPATYEKWRASVPDDFIFTVKGHRFITHNKKLHEVAEPLANFFASGILALGDKLGCVLWQLPPVVKFDAVRMEAFLRSLPKDLKSATRLARKHGPKVAGRDYFPPPRTKNSEIRHAIEVRNESFRDPAFAKLLAKYQVAVVTADSAGQFPYFEDVTAPFAYVRLHGHVEMYASGYPDEALDEWAAKIKKWSRTRDVYVYFDNDIKVQAPFNAIALLKRTLPEHRPAVTLDAGKVAGLETPGPRLSGPDTRWKGPRAKKPPVSPTPKTKRKKKT